MIKGIIDLLKKLGRFNESVIVIHADHGVGDIDLRVADRLRPLVADSKDLSVREAPHSPSQEEGLTFDQTCPEFARNEFKKSQTYTSLVDLGPTIYGMAKVPIPKHFRGRDISKRSKIIVVGPNMDRKFVILDDNNNNAAYQITDGAMKYLGDADNGYSTELK